MFTTDRERIIDKLPKAKIIEHLKTFLNENEKLKEFAQEKTKEILSQQNIEKLDVVDAVKTWINEDPDIAEILSGKEIDYTKEQYNKIGNSGLGIPNSIKNKSSNQIVIDEFFEELKEIPTYFLPQHREVNSRYIVKVTKGKSFTLKFKSNARVDFFEREKNAGFLNILINGEPAEYGLTSEVGEDEIYFINMDNIYFLSKLCKLKNEEEREYFTQLYKIYMLICGVVAKAEYKRLKSQENSKFESEAETVKEITSNASRMIFVMENIITNINLRLNWK